MGHTPVLMPFQFAGPSHVLTADLHAEDACHCQAALS
jgi:hypothetical protein